jgi:branched-chain amino acid transport system permease protein
VRRRERVDRGIKVRSESIHVLSSPREILYAVAPRAVLIVGLLALPAVLSAWPYWSRVAVSALLVGLLAISFDLLANHAGLVCLGGAFFYGVGGYAAAIASTRIGLPIAVSIPVASVLGAAFCTLLLRPCLALRGIYFAVVTLMFPLLMVRLIEAANVLGGTEGLRGVEGFSSPFLEQYGLVGLVLVALFGLRRYVSEDAGIVLRAVRDDDQAVRAAGIGVEWVRMRALFLASLLGCAAGAFYTHSYGTVGISAFALDLSIVPIAATVIGGAGTLTGPLLGSLLLVPLGELLRDFGSLRIAVFALFLTAVVVLRSEGILPFATRKYQQFERWVDV